MLRPSRLGRRALDGPARPPKSGGARRGFTRRRSDTERLSKGAAFLLEVSVAISRRKILQLAMAPAVLAPRRTNGQDLDRPCVAIVRAGPFQQALLRGVAISSHAAEFAARLRSRTTLIVATDPAGAAR